MDLCNSNATKISLIQNVKRSELELSGVGKLINVKEKLLFSKHYSLHNRNFCFGGIVLRRDVASCLPLSVFPRVTDLVWAIEPKFRLRLV